MSDDAAPLPVTIAPSAGEALDGYLERVADANHLTTAALLRLATQTGIGRFLLLKPTDPVLGRLATLTGLPASDLLAASLSGLDDAVLDLTGLDPEKQHSYRVVAARGWAAVHGTQICPRCLAADGFWQLRWRTPFAAICTQHTIYLLTRCPGCGRPFRDQRHSPLRAVGASLECGNPLSAGPRKHCRTNLTQLRALHAPVEEVDTQRRIDTAVTGSTTPVLGVELPGGDYLRELRSLAVLLFHLAAQPTARAEPAWVDAVQTATAERTDVRGPRWGIRPPDDPVARAGAFDTADRILSAPDLNAGAEQLTPWLDRVPHVPDGVLGWVADRTQMTETLSSLAIRAHAPHRRLSHLLDDTEAPLPAAAVPQVVSQADYRRHLDGLFDSAPDTVRLFAAICLARTNPGVHSWAEAGAELGLPPGLAESTARACSARALVSPRRVVDAATAVAHDLPAVNRRKVEADVRRLRRRRAWFTAFAATRPGTRSTSKGYAITSIWTNVAGGHLTTSPGWDRSPTRQQRALYRQFARSLTPANRQQLRSVVGLDEHARPGAIVVHRRTTAGSVDTADHATLTALREGAS